MKKLLIFTIIVAGGLMLLSDLAFAQPTDPGIRDTLKVDRQNGRLHPNTSVVRYVWGYHDEGIGGVSIPLKYKTAQTDVTLDSVRYHPDMNVANLKDSIRNDTAGTIILLFVSFSVIPAGTDTFAALYFTTGPSWDSTLYTPIDTFRIGGSGGQGLSYTDTSASPVDITPHYDPPGNLDVKNDPSQSAGVPKSFSLSQNYPNPFNAETVISFGLPRASQVKLEIYNILGQKVKDLIDERVTAGFKRVVWDGRDNNGNTVSSGVYFYKLVTGDFTEVLKMTLLK